MIESKHNPQFKELLRIKTKGSATGYVLLEGERAQSQLSDYGLSFESFYRDQPEENGLVAGLFDRLCATVNPQSVLMKVKLPEEREFSPGPVLILDQIRDPGNLGSLLRSASAFGVDNILLLEGSVDVYNDKVLRSSLGAVLSLNIRQRANLEQVRQLYRPLFFADLGGDDFSQVIYPDNFGLVIGSEAHGISAELQSLPHVTITIPMVSAMESLNAGVAGGILLQHLMQKTSAT